MNISIKTTAILGGSGILITFFYNWHNRKLANDKMHKDLFTEFNIRYDKLNDNLFEIKSSVRSLDELDENTHLKSKLNDFYNLCAEEYFWYKKKRIDPKVWMGWEAGMNYWYNEVPVIKDAWLEELKNNGYMSYYMKPGDSFFTDKK